MLASHQWLLELSSLSLTPDETARRLTALGLEVESVRSVGAVDKQVVVAEVRRVASHPHRPKLSVVDVWDGAREWSVVCGAPNVPAPGFRVALARLGATLPDGLVIEKRALGGIDSSGMLASEAELHLGADSDGILVFAPDEPLELGKPLREALRLNDAIFDISVTPNRPDCLGHRGLARDLCAALGKPFGPKLKAPEASKRVADVPALAVEIREASRCARYGASFVLDVEPGPSPFWLRYRLHNLGIRAIQNIVDCTNLALLEHGHPIHAFDFDRLAGASIVVRCAGKAEKLTTLDGVTRDLHPDDLVICDAEKPIALAGVMGGKDSEITTSTKRVVIECAYFDPRSVRRTARRHGLHTDASHRFERGVDPQDVVQVLGDSSAWVTELARGRAGVGVIDCVAAPYRARRMTLRAGSIKRLLGRDVSAAAQEAILGALGCDVTRTNDATLEVVAPSFRPDLAREADLVEELARIEGYDAIATELPHVQTNGDDAARRSSAFVRSLRDGARAAGLFEAINYAFVAPRELSISRCDSGVAALANPLSEERSVLRTSLLPGLLGSARRSLRHQVSSVRLFEVARVFHERKGPRSDADGVQPDETLRFGVLLCGPTWQWLGEGPGVEFLDGKGAVDVAVSWATGHAIETVFASDVRRQASCLHPRKSAVVQVGGTPVGHVGEVHPDVIESWDLGASAVFAELDVSTLLSVVDSIARGAVASLPKYPAVVRDAAIVVGQGVAAGEVAECMRTASDGVAEDVRLFDLYTGPPVPEGQKSLAFRVLYRDPSGTLTDARVEEVHQRVLDTVRARFAAAVRS